MNIRANRKVTILVLLERPLQHDIEDMSSEDLVVTILVLLERPLQLIINNQSEAVKKVTILVLLERPLQQKKIKRGEFKGFKVTILVLLERPLQQHMKIAVFTIISMENAGFKIFLCRLFLKVLLINYCTKQQQSYFSIFHHYIYFFLISSLFN